MNPLRQVVLDACVLVPPTLCDLLLRLAEDPPLYIPRWSEETLDEVRRNQIRVGLSEERAKSWREAVNTHFPQAMVTGYGFLLDQCANHPKDRHVLAAAIRSSASLIVTANLRDFPQPALVPWGLEAVPPDEFLITLYGLEPGEVVTRLSEMAARRDLIPSEILVQLGKVVPRFAAVVEKDLA